MFFRLPLESLFSSLSVSGGNRYSIVSVDEIQILNLEFLVMRSTKRLVSVQLMRGGWMIKMAVGVNRCDDSYDREENSETRGQNTIKVILSPLGSSWSPLVVI